ncbi:MAG: PKD domain-containing protein [Bacteroidetes bacterium]|nr:PKD domain-containing protein [Bacteroidota bacterium]
MRKTPIHFIRIYVCLACIAMFFFKSDDVIAQATSSCTNSDFELNNFANWNGETGTCCPIVTSPSGIISGRHTIMSGPGFDPYSLGQIPVVCPGGVYSARLGNDQVNSQAEKLKYTFPVTLQTCLFIYRYAVVLEDPAHPPADQPRFQISVLDQNNHPVNCGSYNVVSGGTIPGFFNNGSYRLKNWTTVGIELASYIGQNVTIIFATGDCAQGGHFGYAYIDCYCSPLQISNDLCPGANVVNLSAPIGFASYLWSNGATTPSISLVNPTLGATYTVTMTSVTGCVVTLSTLISPTYAIANFNTASVCSNDAVFIDSSYSSGGSPITSWNWDFGDGQNSTDRYPVHSFASPGTYNVSLIVENAIGCNDTVIIPVNIQPVPEAEFAYTNVCNHDDLFPVDQSTIAIGNVNQWHWDFGDGTAIDTTQNPVHPYPLEGNYQITLIVTGDNGCVDSISHSVTVYPSPTATFTATEVCLNNPVVFNDQSLANVGFITDWSWDFGDLTTSSNQNPVHLYNYAVPFDVRLVVVSNNGCTDTLVNVVTVHPLPVPGINNMDACIGDTSRFYDVTYISWGSIASREWNFGDGTPVSNDPYPVHRYALPGRYDVQLKSTSDFGCENATTKMAVVYDKPVPAFVASSTEGCEPFGVTFADLSTVHEGYISGWNWEFGDGSPVDHITPAYHVFEKDGNYSISLTTVSNLGCRDSLTLNEYIHVHPKPESGFRILPDNPTSLFPTVYLFDEFNGATGWIYYFGDGDSTSSENPEHVYKAAGDYQVMQIVSNQFQCFDTTARMLHVENDYTLYVPNSFTPNGDGKNDFFEATGFDVRSFSMSIYNRWGNLIFQTNDISKAWDGKLNGVPIEAGIYVYSIVALDAFNEEHQYMGNVALVR